MRETNRIKTETDRNVCAKLSRDRDACTETEQRCHSHRNAVNGSTRSARRAGRIAAISAIAVMVTMTPAIESASIGVRPKSSYCRYRLSPSGQRSVVLFQIAVAHVTRHADDLEIAVVVHERDSPARGFLFPNCTAGHIKSVFVIAYATHVLYQIDGYSVPDPPWLVCKNSESRIFELHDLGEEEFEMRILDSDEVVIASRTFKTRQLAAEWGFAERQELQFDGWKHPYDAAIDDTFEEGVRNWNLLVLGVRGKKFPLWEAYMLIAEARRACEQYACAPYLGMLTIDELFERFRLLGVSLMDINSHGFLEPAAWDELHDKWIHAATEILLRDLSLDDERGRPDWSFVQTTGFRRAVSAYKRRTLKCSDKILVKYGSAEFLRPALKQGIVRISPASYYNDPSLNAARRDAELDRVLIDAASDLTSTIRLRPEELREEPALYTRLIQSTTDYYIFCLAGGWQPRLFNDFNADACLVITDPTRFARALGEAVRNRLPDWHFTCEFVRYIDPIQELRFMNRGVEVRFAPFLCKDFRFSYQKEIRAAWLPPNPEGPRMELEHLFITLGNLEDYCEMIEI